MLLGVGVTVWLVRSIGFDDIVASARQMGIGGFLLVCIASIGLFTLLGAAWQAAAGEPARRIPLFSLARLVREAAADFLPFSQIGGMAAGARVVRSGGIPTPRIYASMMADQATEMASQILFSLAGVAAATAFLAHDPAHAELRRSIIGGVVALGALLMALLFGQGRFLTFVSKLAARVLPGLSSIVSETSAELTRIYRAPHRIALSFLWNLLAWLAMAAVAWLILQLIGHPLAFWRMVAIESAIAVVRSAAFLVPGGLGLQEAAYAVVGPLFGLPPGPAIALSLVKRARDGALALVSFISWQLVEVSTLKRRKTLAPSA